MSEDGAGHSEAPSLEPADAASAVLHTVSVEARAVPAELTVRALVAGGLVGMVLALTNLYAGLKTGFWESGCVLSSLLAFSGMSAVSARRGSPPSALETNLAQTAAVSVGAVPASAGLLGAIPALALLGARAPEGAVALWGLGLGLLGVLLAFSLRRRLLEEEALPFATGVATAELISTLHASREAPSVRTRALGLSSLGAMLLTWLREVTGVVPTAWLLPAGRGVGGVPARALLLGVGLHPMMLGIGMLAGPRSGLSMLLGASVAWGGLAPWLVREGLGEQVE